MVNLGNGPADGLDNSLAQGLFGLAQVLDNGLADGLA